MASLRGLLDSLAGEAVSALLFLKSIQRLELYEWQPDQAAPRLSFSCALCDASPQLLHERSFFVRAAAGSGDNSGADAVSSTYVARFESRGGADGRELLQRQSYLISQACGGGGSRALAAEASR